ncbi:glycosyltransferase [Prevotella sp. OH937_COT-195]|uniref:glycosyltransferase n=1 Tax=Prevotella sp. OH937_COT-195 TaxID=2491051 RepID=UPI000F64F1D8|nr:glycosyltransferase [Prevotella sp. OH937_COT-195]RRD00867.1 glycosyltransferase [Prevotella sp. OH937_COT-195]
MLNTIIISILAIVAIISPLLSIYMRRQRFDTPDVESEGLPVSVIIAVHDNAEELESNLPAFLGQDYPPGFEIIVVAAKSEDGTEDVLKRFKGNEKLYTTFIPDSSRYISRRKLALTLGVKAAHHSLLLFTDITCRPASDKWIESMAGCMKTGKNIVIGMTVYDEDTPLPYRFQRLYDDMAHANEASFGIAYSSASKNIMTLRDDFMNRRGFEGNLKYMRGEYDFIINKYAAKDCTAVTNSPDALLVEKCPTDREWRNHRLFYMETRRHLQRKTRHRMPLLIDGILLYSSLLLPIAATAYGAMSNDITVLVSAPTAMLFSVVLRSVIARKRMAQFFTEIPAWKIVPLEVGSHRQKLIHWLAYKRADKYDFITHKI